MQTWLSVDEFSQLVGKTSDEVLSLCEEDKINHKKENDIVYIEASQATQTLIPVAKTEIITDPKGDSVLEKTISAILNLHERVLEAKDETIGTLQGENEFLKSTVLSVQEIYDEDRKTIHTLQKQLQIAQEELEFCRKKYKLMWGKVIKKSAEEE